jgi:hypothetical protein
VNPLEVVDHLFVLLIGWLIDAFNICFFADAEGLWESKKFGASV